MEGAEGYLHQRAEVDLERGRRGIREKVENKGTRGKGEEVH